MPGEKMACNLFFQHLYGWSDGAAARPMNPVRCKHSDFQMVKAYEQGYTEGQTDKRAVAKRLSETYGYSPSPLRVNELKSSPAKGVLAQA